MSGLHIVPLPPFDLGGGGGGGGGGKVVAFFCFKISVQKSV